MTYKCSDTDTNLCLIAFFLIVMKKQSFYFVFNVCTYPFFSGIRNPKKIQLFFFLPIAQSMF